MENLKITIDQIKNYLGTGLRLEVDESATKEPIFLGLYNEPWDRLLVYFGSGSAVDLRMIDEVKPICFRLSDLDKFIPEFGFVPIEEIRIELMRSWCGAYDEFIEITFPFKDLSQAPFEIFQQFVKWHFWPFGEEYFEQGLVIDKLKLQCTP